MITFCCFFSTRRQCYILRKREGLHARAHELPVCVWCHVADRRRPALLTGVSPGPGGLCCVGGVRYDMTDAINLHITLTGLPAAAARRVRHALKWHTAWSRHLPRASLSTACHKPVQDAPRMRGDVVLGCAPFIHITFFFHPPDVFHPLPIPQ